MEYGGFPEIVVGGNIEELQQLYQDVLIKDLLVRFKIRETKAFREVALFLLSNVSNPVSFNKGLLRSIYFKIRIEIHIGISSLPIKR